MKITKLNGSAVDLHAADKNSALIHVCNNVGIMGSGIALEVKNRYPKTFEAYRKNFNLNSVSFDADDLIFNMVAQTLESKPVNLNYGNLAVCLDIVGLCLFDSGINRVYVPELMGALRAGGDWLIVKQLVEEILNSYNPNIEIIYCNFGLK